MKLWPTWMDDARLMAKSEALGGQTLAEHTRDVLEHLQDMLVLHRELELIAGKRLWQQMYWGCLLHDFGKAAIEFQERLQGVKNQWAEYGQRHEILSLGFVDWLFARGHQDRNWVITIIAYHHKDADTIFDLYGGRHLLKEEASSVRDSALTLLPHLAAQISEDTRWQLWRWLAECSDAWADELGIEVYDRPQLMPFEQAVTTNLEKSIFQALRDLAVMQGGLSVEEKKIAHLYRGLILTADHAASAGAPAFPALRLTREIAARPLPKNTEDWRSHQHNADQSANGSLLMIAPTGSGKTEAAMLWATRQLEHRPASRLFYTLPYQASMNAMAQRLKEKFFEFKTDEENDQVTIQHSRATLKFYQDMMEADSGLNPKQAARSAKARKNRAELNYYPVQVFSPYQMLKAAFSLKGYEALLVDYTNGLFIFDEIHAYEPSRLALIITTMGWLAEQYGARFLVMTATLPPMVEEALKKALRLSDKETIVASEEVFRQSQRHEVHLLDGDLLSALDKIAAEGWQQKVLVCCNQVGRAQEIYRRLKDEYGFTRDYILLLHGRFNGKDRTKKEGELADIVGVRKPKRPYIVVATQVVEVSLDIDLDTIYTEPAPLEALLQRFGRVNRGRGASAPLCPVHVFRQPVGENESKPYDEGLVEASLEILERFCGDNRAIDESLVTSMLYDIYKREAIASKWRAEYEHSERSFRETLDRMKPFQSADLGLFQEFYKLFDGTQVLPVDCENDYYTALDDGGFLAASQYLVSISWGQYNQMMQTQKRLGKRIIIKREEDEFADHVDIPYSEEWGLDIAGALAVKDEDE
jgi:CRISPR-associated endonuclease/helicase Cas3